jgi:hypothetical protein
VASGGAGIIPLHYVAKEAGSTVYTILVGINDLATALT